MQFLLRLNLGLRGGVFRLDNRYDAIRELHAIRDHLVAQDLGLLILNPLVFNDNQFAVLIPSLEEGHFGTIHNSDTFGRN